MQPYLVYGFGIRAKNLPSDVRQRLIDARPSEATFEWFSEDDAGRNSEDSGVFYLLKSSPFSRKASGSPDLPWAEDLEALLAFRAEHESQVEQRLRSLELMDYADCVEFLCSVTEI